jgi:RNA polymerase sigma-70 factor (ECF subfamily)
VTVVSSKMRAKNRLEQAAPPEERSDEAAFEAVFHQHYPRVFGVIRRLVGDPAEAEDLALEAFWRLYRRPTPQPSQPGRDHNLGGWLYRVAMNLGLNAVRAGKRRQQYEEAAGRWEMLANGEPDPQEEAEAEETRRRVRRTLAGMNSRQAQLLVLRHSGLAYREIAEALALAPGSIGTLLARAEREFEQRYLAEER